MSMRHPVFARLYPMMGRAMERGGMAERRQALLAGVTGEVVEVGAGDGLNFAHYPSTVTRVLAVEPEPRLRQLAHAAAGRAAIPVEVVDGLAEQLPVEDSTVDAAVVTLVLCSVREQEAALREIRRVLKPDGQLRFLEHVRADTPGLARVQRVLDATVWPRLAGGCHTGRDTVAAIERSGFAIERLDRFLFPGARTPSSFHILGTAVRRS
ncbi:Ubiquinone/menaquinone biosynthesis C-methylase UbiE [Amycolatopsis arida]|uniref:Ubiquinone/menaquinone biosynthesis C-methylase UbiE n=2 Tax=Amycolatopsis arida TaxID=587909 RepID=A0A1I6ACS4_9PSEU|nr:ubiquinone/menaquinone biosynthesis C-methylase UbiE [Amycolatopsis arida]SFQ66544.1 Ubiquinone/menaquinone biosynthesis C-methylase UbiE [Amycolatopsis arida]